MTFKEMTIEEKRYEIDEVFNMIGEVYLSGNSDDNKTRSNMIVDGFNVRPVSLRYKTFYQKGIKCVCCGKEGTHFKLCGDETTNRRHFNLFAEDGTLMTKDHIIPKSKGGPDLVSNMQTMCVNCNKAKGNTCDIKIEYIVGKKEDGKEITFRSLEKAAFHLAQNYSHCNGSKISKNDATKIGITTIIKLIAAIENGCPYHEYVWTKEMK